MELMTFYPSKGGVDIKMSERETILNELMQVIGEEASVFEDEDGWKMMLEGFMEPWKLGRTVSEAKAAIREYARMGLGLS
jgi:hypothetical protein